MYILLEPGMKIKAGDEFYIDGEWTYITTMNAGKMYCKDHGPICRKITTIKELVEALGE